MGAVPQRRVGGTAAKPCFQASKGIASSNPSRKWKEEIVRHLKLWQSRWSENLTADVRQICHWTWSCWYRRLSGLLQAHNFTLDLVSPIIRKHYWVTFRACVLFGLRSCIHACTPAEFDVGNLASLSFLSSSNALNCSFVSKHVILRGVGERRTTRLARAWRWTLCL